jgi:hypothetical protein
MAPKKMLAPVLALTATLAVAAPALADGGVVKVRDACDPASFNAGLGDGFCVREDGGPRVKLDDALATLAQRGSVPKWSFSRERVTLDRGEDLVVRFDRGGETHTFTEVAQFGPGCVPQINQLMGADGPPAADCALIMPTAVGPMNKELDVDGLSAGVHRFQCLIHPWMKSTVTVR